MENGKKRKWEMNIGKGMLGFETRSITFQKEGDLLKLYSPKKLPLKL